MAVLEPRLHVLSLVLCFLRVFGGPTVPVTGPHRCYSFKSHTFLLTKENLIWAETEEFCKRFQGVLPTPQDRVQVAFLSTQIDWKALNVKRYWIGLRSVTPNSGWNWKDGSPLTFSNWNTNRPTFDIMSLPDCAFVSVENNYKWEDMLCMEKKDISAVCHIKNHAWSSWSKWSDCDCDNYIRQRTRVCGSSSEARIICPCPGMDTQMKICTCLSRWKEFRKDDSRTKHFILIKRVSAENVVVCSMFCLEEEFCYRFSFPGRNTCNLYKKATTSPVAALANDDITNVYVVVNEGQWISSF